VNPVGLVIATPGNLSFFSLILSDHSENSNTYESRSKAARLMARMAVGMANSLH
jgi:hypothetical protein